MYFLAVAAQTVLKGKDHFRIWARSRSFFSSSNVSALLMITKCGWCLTVMSSYCYNSFTPCGVCPGWPLFSYVSWWMHAQCFTDYIKHVVVRMDWDSHGVPANLIWEYIPLKIFRLRNWDINQSFLTRII